MYILTRVQKQNATCANCRKQVEEMKLLSRPWEKENGRKNRQTNPKKKNKKEWKERNELEGY